MTNRVEVGVYTITNRISGRVYVGSSKTNVSKRKLQHWNRLKNGTHGNKGLQKDWRLFGEDVFVFEVLEVVDVQDCVPFEQFWINMLRANESAFGYNLLPCAGSSRGFKHSESGLKRLSDINKGKVLGEEHRAKISAALKGRTKSEETRRKLSAAHKGKRLSPETIEKMRARTYSTETLAKRSVSLKAAWERRKARASAQEKTRTGDSV